jgi:hypothetical protein
MGVYNPAAKAQITGGEAWGRDGIGGINKEPGTWMWTFYPYKDGAPSLTTTANARPSDTFMFTQSGTPDLQWGFDWNPDEAFRLWGDGVFNLFGDANMTTGPMGRTGTSGQDAGVYPTSISEPTNFPKGLNISVYCDGHAKAIPWRGLHSQTVSNGTVKYLKYAAPEIN